MTYELAKKLKDAGFPNLGMKNGVARWEDKEGSYYLIDRDKLPEDSIYQPTLSELIAACGNFKNFMLVRMNGEWQASSADELNIDFLLNLPAKAETPIEAVANLYLALHISRKNNI